MSKAGTPELIPPERLDPLQRSIIHDHYKGYREPSSGATAAYQSTTMARTLSVGH